MPFVCAGAWTRRERRGGRGGAAWRETVMRDWRTAERAVSWASGRNKLQLAPLTRSLTGRTLPVSNRSIDLTEIPSILWPAGKLGSIHEGTDCLLHEGVVLITSQLEPQASPASAVSSQPAQHTAPFHAQATSLCRSRHKMSGPGS